MDRAGHIEKESGGAGELRRSRSDKKLLDLAGRKLEEAGVPVYFATRKDEFKSSPVRMLHAILRLVNSTEDKQSLARLSKAFYELEGISIELAPVLSRASADGKDLLRS
jgi:DNA helicase-2/ATP-dependent DNA helicase PcrA